MYFCTVHEYCVIWNVGADKLKFVAIHVSPLHLAALENDLM